MTKAIVSLLTAVILSSLGCSATGPEATPSTRLPQYASNNQSQTTVPAPVGGQPVDQEEYLSSISSGVAHSCGVRTNGIVECWGSSVGPDGEYVGHSTPPSGRFKSVSAGLIHSCGLRFDGSILCWGDDRRGQSSAPEGTFRSVSAGAAHTCGLRTDGSVQCWGYDNRGQSSPPNGLFISISSGATHTCGVGTDDLVQCWGDDRRGQSSPPNGKFKSVSLGVTYSCGLRTNDSVECWGDDRRGQSSAPEGTFRSVSAGAAHACGLRTDGSVQCWGDDQYGQASPPEGLFSTISAGSTHSCGVRRDNLAECWGLNTEGQSAPPQAISAVTQGPGPSQGSESDRDIGFTIDNPIPRGGAMYFDNGLALSVIDVIENANRTVQEHNPLFAGAPGSGKQFLIVTILVNNEGDSPVDLWMTMGNLGLVGDSGVSYLPGALGGECLFYPKELNIMKTVFPGGVETGNVCFSVMTAEVDSLRLYVQDAFGEFAFWELTSP